MTEFVSVLSCIRGGVDLEDKSYSNGSGEAGEDEEHLDEKEEKEVEDIVEDFMAMANKDMLRRDLKRMATENVNLRKKVARYVVEVELSNKSYILGWRLRQRLGMLVLDSLSRSIAQVKMLKVKILSMCSF